MTTSAPPTSSVPIRTASVVLLPGEKFFVRRIPLTPGQDAAAQVELALETVGPFSPAQIFYGYCPSKDGTQALLFAAFRKNFTAEEIASWATAEIVVPEFVLWLAPASAPAAGTWIYECRDAVQVVAWDGGELPAGILYRKVESGQAESVTGELLEEAARRFHVPAGTPRQLEGNLVIGRWDKEGLRLRLDKPGQTMACQIAPGVARSLDVRDKAELAGLAQQQQRNTWLWRTFAGLAAGLLLCVLLEIGLFAGGGILRRQKAAVTENDAAVKKIELADNLADRMEQLAGQRVRLIGMLLTLQDARPKSLFFTRTTITSPTQLDVEAQTTNAADTNAFEQALRSSPAIKKVEVRDPRFRENVTTFQATVVFKAGFPAEEDDK